MAARARARASERERAPTSESTLPSYPPPPRLSCRRVSLKAFSKFIDTAEALQSATALVEGKLSSGMKKFLKKNAVSSEVRHALALASPSPSP